jgi:hypothetical protein
VNQQGYHATWAGSQLKRTDVSGYSDGDIWVETGGKVVNDDTRKYLCQRIKERLQVRSMLVVDGPVYKPLASAISVEARGVVMDDGCYASVSFYCERIDFDIVFSKNTWVANKRLMDRPDASGFYKKFDRQRAVKALKLLSREVSC